MLRRFATRCCTYIEYSCQNHHKRNASVEFQCNRWFSSNRRRCSVFEPDGIGDPPEIDEYSELKLSLHAYDFTILESYSRYVHRLCMNLSITTKHFAVPPRTSKVHTFIPNSDKIQSEFNLSTYERAFILEDLPCTKLPILLDVMRQNVPAGVKYSLEYPDLEEEEFRFVPDKEIIELRDQLAEIDRAREESKKNK